MIEPKIIPGFSAPFGDANTQPGGSGSGRLCVAVSGWRQIYDKTGGCASAAYSFRASPPKTADQFQTTG